MPVRRTKHLWWVRPKWLYAKPAVRVTHARDLVPRGCQWSRAAPGFTTFFGMEDGHSCPSGFPRTAWHATSRVSGKSAQPPIPKTQTLQETPPYLTVRRFKGAGSRTSRVQLGVTRCEGVAVQTSQISIVLWFRKQTGRRQVANQSQGLGDCGTRKSRRPVTP